MYIQLIRILNLRNIAVIDKKKILSSTRERKKLFLLVKEKNFFAALDTLAWVEYLLKIYSRWSRILGQHRGSQSVRKICFKNVMDTLTGVLEPKPSISHYQNYFVSQTLESVAPAHPYHISVGKIVIFFIE